MRESRGQIDRIQSPLGAALKRRRLDLGLSQEELANRAGLHRTYITDVERGSRNPSLDTIQKLAGALQVALSELFLQIESAGAEAPPSKGAEAVEILVVESNPVDAETTLLALRENRITNHIQVVRDANDAIDFLFSTGSYRARAHLAVPRVILLDLNLPGIGGVEVLRRIRADRRTRSIPVAVITTSHPEGDLKACAEMGVQVYLTKPVDFAQFSHAMPRLGFGWLLLSRRTEHPTSRTDTDRSGYAGTLPGS
jgi:CheY-like chemotaxis protein/DNA-binding XRE family transcriptional regulator